MPTPVQAAVVSATVQVTPAWTDPDERAFRQTLAAGLLEYLEPVPAQDDAGPGPPQRPGPDVRSRAEPALSPTRPPPAGARA